MTKYQFTILVPLYNEEDNAERLERELTEFLPKAMKKACVLFVDDGSTDRSLLRIKDICARHADFFYLALAKNSGLSAALKAGFDAARTPLVGYIDADLQTVPADFNLHLPYADDYALVAGIRRGRKDTTFKRVQSKIANAFRRAMTHDGAEDTGCPLKVMHTDAARRVPMFTGMHRFFPALIQLGGGRMKQVAVSHRARTAGTSKYHLWNRLIGPFVDCFAYRWMASRYIRYEVSEQKTDA